MPRIFMKNTARNLIIGILIIFFDQISKYQVRSDARFIQGINIIGDFFKLVYVKNDGAAFSSFSGQRFFLLAIPTLVILTAVYAMYKYRQKHFTLNLAILLICAGGIGNLIDRAIFGFVTDMISFSIFPPVFNIADIAVTCGCAMLFIYVLIIEPREESKSK